MYTYTWVIVLFAALCGQSAIGSYYHGPIAEPLVLKSGFLADTHEVAAAKSIHLATLAEQSHGYGDEQGNEEYRENSHGDGHLKYHGPTAIPHVLHDGHIADTQEVAAAKAEHLATVAKAKSYSHGQEGGYSEGYSGESKLYSDHAVSYHGPIAKPVVLKSGYLADTHEVAAAKQHHLQALHSTHQEY